MKSRRGCRSGGGSVVVAAVALALALALATVRPASAAVTFGQLDNFQDGTTMSWEEGVASPNPPTNVASGGPRGEGDRYLQNISAGNSSGGRMVMFNTNQWAGDYNAAGVTQIDASFVNLGATPLYIRLAFLSGSSVYGSTAAVELPPDGVWRRGTFDLTSNGLTIVEGTETLSQALSHVMFLRMISAQAGPALIGDFVAGTLGLDDMRALRLPGDANFDGRVDSTDYRIARLNLGARGPRTWAQGDFDFDGRVSALDLLTLRRNFGMSIPPAAAASARAAALAVPEPTSALLLLATPVLLLRRRRRS